MAEIPALRHTPEDCFQTEALREIQYSLKHITPVIKRLEDQGERTARALELIAEQGAIVGSHEKRLDKQDKDLSEAFRRINENQDTTNRVLSAATQAAELDKRQLAARLDEIMHEISDIKVRLAKEDGAEEVIQEKKKFWDQVKVALSPSWSRRPSSSSSSSTTLTWAAASPSCGTW
jgi:hypothetical protein